MEATCNGIFRSLILLVLVMGSSTADVYFNESFIDGLFPGDWISSSYNTGSFEIQHGIIDDDFPVWGLQTTAVHQNHIISTKFDSFSNLGKKLVVQFRVKFEQYIDCGGGYIKLFPEGFDPATLNANTPYSIMFGPDICGHQKKLTQLIFRYNYKTQALKKHIPAISDIFSHVYTLIIHPGNTYEVLIDNKLKRAGSLEDDWDMIAPKLIRDVNARKPNNWVENKMIPDPKDYKPDGYDNIPKLIPNPNTIKPNDWDDDLDGVWEPPMISNPNYRGEWSPKMIPNPDYKGEWVAPLIENPDYKQDEELYVFELGGIGIDVWQVKPGTVYSDFLICDDIELARTEAERILSVQSFEKKIQDAIDQELAKKS
eukprot:TRINITY_DN7089_c0_g1_i1.p1 TRINITY_DN7089_c0_g1~~TRINITY_DN7089_c0_g1_i1.p1  ORF type:complete len:370 (-),score=69.53 TRINITY_DN7089_c0_g1_i1:11-1120(-)